MNAAVSLITEHSHRNGVLDLLFFIHLVNLTSPCLPGRLMMFTFLTLQAMQELTRHFKQIATFVFGSG